MIDLPMLRTMIGIIAIIGALACFLAFWRITFIVAPQARKTASETLTGLNLTAQTVSPVSTRDIAELLKALASLADSLAKAGPALWSLIASVLYLLIAALAAGVFVGSPERSAPASAGAPAAPGDNTQATADENLPVSPR